MTPSTPRPCSDCATTACTGFAVAQKIEHTSGTSLIRPSTLIGYPSFMTTTNTCPAARADAFRTAIAFSPSSLPSARVRHGPDASLNATPNFICGTVFTIASYTSSTVLMKCVCPSMRLPPSGTSSGTSFSSMGLSIAVCAHSVTDLADFYNPSNPANLAPPAGGFGGVCRVPPIYTEGGRRVRFIDYVFPQFFRRGAAGSRRAGGAAADHDSGRDL